jgi:hypothetical protein
MSKRNLRPPVTGTSVFKRLLADWHVQMSPTVARKVLTIGFGRADQDRMADLADRNQDGALTPEEKAELLEYVSAGHYLARLHAQARIALKATKRAKD